MLENLPKNGSFVERRKVFVQFPFHSLNHHLPFDWTGEDRSSQEKRRKLNQSLQEHEQIRRSYDMKIEMKMRQKYSKKVDTFRVIPNQITSRQDQEALSKQVQHFNNSKMNPNSNPQLAEHSEQAIANHHQSSIELTHKARPDSRYHVPYVPTEHRGEGLQNRYEGQQHYDESRLRHSSSQIDGYSPHLNELERYRSPYLLKNSYGPNSLPHYRKYANLCNSTQLHPLEIPTHSVRNYLPDQLQGFLRDKSKLQQRRRPLHMSLSTNKRQP